MDRSVVLARASAQLPLLKVQPGAVVRLKVLALRVAWFATHWLGRRQVLCAAGRDGECAGCALSPSRVVGFQLVTLVIDRRERLFLLEVSPLAISSLEMSAKFEGVSRLGGILVEVRRPRARGPLRFEVVEECSESIDPAEGDARLINAVAVLYGLPLLFIGETVEAWEERVSPMVRSLVSVAAGAVVGKSV